MYVLEYNAYFVCGLRTVTEKKFAGHVQCSELFYNTFIYIKDFSRVLVYIDLSIQTMVVCQCLRLRKETNMDMVNNGLIMAITWSREKCLKYVQLDVIAFYIWYLLHLLTSKWIIDQFDILLYSVFGAKIDSVNKTSYNVKGIL